MKVNVYILLTYPYPLLSKAASHLITKKHHRQSTKIKLDVTDIPRWRGEGGWITTLKIYDITGREVQTLVNDKLQPGTYETTFDGSQLTSGVYFCQMVSGEFKQTRKLTLLK